MIHPYLQLEFLGEIIQFLDNQDIVVDLSDNSIQYLEGTNALNPEEKYNFILYQKLTTNLSSRRREKVTLTLLTMNSTVAAMFR